MSGIILLDSGPLGLITNPKGNQDSVQCVAWLNRTLGSGKRVLVPAISDYETRRELVRANKPLGVRKLDDLRKAIGYLPLTDEALLKAAEFWAVARQQGFAMADRFALDGDAILAAQAATLDPALFQMPNALVVIATMNVAHLSRFVPAQDWRTL